MDGGYLIRLDDAARRLKTTRLNVLMQLKTGGLAGELRDGEWYVSEVSLESFLAEGSKRVRCAATSCACTGGCRMEETP